MLTFHHVTDRTSLYISVHVHAYQILRRAVSRTHHAPSSCRRKKEGNQPRVTQGTHWKTQCDHSVFVLYVVCRTGWRRTSSRVEHTASPVTRNGYHQHQPHQIPPPRQQSRHQARYYRTRTSFQTEPVPRAPLWPSAWSLPWLMVLMLSSLPRRSCIETFFLLGRWPAVGEYLCTLPSIASELLALHLEFSSYPRATTRGLDSSSGRPPELGRPGYVVVECTYLLSV
ncbi:hypothetical protein F4824DRAFT_66670 [Ustulina deusta]|nr:hypothetical protein F4823DRAFT_355400 [Ustulina deusta]KAI3338971.1 hypothetical protein F4824DRAFT_66670 [Ustulina deusta]